MMPDFADVPHASQPGRNLLWLRIGVLLIFVIALVLVLISFLNYSNYRKTYLDLNLTRYLILAKDLRQTVVAGLNVGLNPGENVRLAPAIKELAQRESGIRFIGVLDESGAVISDGKVPAAAAAAWRSHLGSTTAGEYWQTSDATTLQIGIPFVNNFNLKAGAVVIGYDRAAIEAATDNMLLKLSIDIVATLLVLAALTLAGVYVLTRKFAAELASVGRTLDSALNESVPQKIDGHFLSGSEAQDINEFTTLSHRVASEIARLEWELMRPRQAGRERSEERA